MSTSENSHLEKDVSQEDASQVQEMLNNYQLKTSGATKLILNAAATASAPNGSTMTIYNIKGNTFLGGKNGSGKTSLMLHYLYMISDYAEITKHKNAREKNSLNVKDTPFIHEENFLFKNAYKRINENEMERYENSNAWMAMEFERPSIDGGVKYQTLIVFNKNTSLKEHDIPAPPEHRGVFVFIDESINNSILAKFQGATYEEISSKTATELLQAIQNNGITISQYYSIRAKTGVLFGWDFDEVLYTRFKNFPLKSEKRALYLQDRERFKLKIIDKDLKNSEDKTTYDFVKVGEEITNEIKSGKKVTGSTFYNKNFVKMANNRLNASELNEKKDALHVRKENIENFNESATQYMAYYQFKEAEAFLQEPLKLADNILDNLSYLINFRDIYRHKEQSFRVLTADINSAIKQRLGIIDDQIEAKKSALKSNKEEHEQLNNKKNELSAKVKQTEVDFNASDGLLSDVTEQKKKELLDILESGDALHLQWASDLKVKQHELNALQNNKNNQSISQQIAGLKEENERLLAQVNVFQGNITTSESAKNLAKNAYEDKCKNVKKDLKDSFNLEVLSPFKNDKATLEEITKSNFSFKNFYETPLSIINSFVGLKQNLGSYLNIKLNDKINELQEASKELDVKIAAFENCNSQLHEENEGLVSLNKELANANGECLDLNTKKTEIANGIKENNNTITSNQNKIRELNEKIAGIDAKINQQTLIKLATEEGSFNVKKTIAMLDDSLLELDLDKNEEIFLEQDNDLDEMSSGVFINGKRLQISDENIEALIEQKITNNSLSNLEEQKKKCNNEIIECNNKIEECSKKIKGLTPQLNDIGNQLDACNKAIEALKEEIERANAQFQDKKANASNALMAIDKQVLVIKQLASVGIEDIKRKISQETDKFNSLLDEKVSQHEDVISAKNMFEQNAENFNKTSKELTPLINDLQEKINNNTELGKELSNNISQTDKEKIDLLNQEIKGLQFKVNFFHNNKNTYRNWVNKSVALEKAIKEYDDFNNTKQQRIDALDKDIRESVALIESLKQEKTDLSDKSKEFDITSIDELLSSPSNPMKKIDDVEGQYTYVIENHQFKERILKKYIEENISKVEENIKNEISYSKEFGENNKLLNLDVNNVVKYSKDKPAGERRNIALQNALRGKIGFNEDDIRAFTFVKLITNKNSGLYNNVSKTINKLNEDEGLAVNSSREIENTFKKILDAFPAGESENIKVLTARFWYSHNNQLEAGSRQESAGEALLSWKALLADMYNKVTINPTNDNPNLGLVMSKLNTCFEYVYNAAGSITANNTVLEKTIIDKVENVAKNIETALNRGSSAKRRAYDKINIKIHNQLEKSTLNQFLLEIKDFFKTSSKYSDERGKELIEKLKRFKETSAILGKSSGDIFLTTNLREEDLFDTQIKVWLSKGNAKREVDITQVVDNASKGNVLTVQVAFIIAATAMSSNGASKRMKDGSVFINKAFIDECGAIDVDNMCHIFDIAKQNNVSLMLTSPTMLSAFVIDRLESANELYQMGENSPTQTNTVSANVSDEAMREINKDNIIQEIA